MGKALKDNRQWKAASSPSWCESIDGKIFYCRREWHGLLSQGTYEERIYKCTMGAGQEIIRPVTAWPALAPGKSKEDRAMNGWINKTARVWDNREDACRDACSRTAKAKEE